jgi:excisionase family DNA binding protein
MTYRTGSRGTTQGEGARFGARREGGGAGHAASGAAQRGVRAGLGADARGVGARGSRGGRHDTAGRAEGCESGVGAAIVVVSPGELRAIVGAAVREAVEAMRDARAEGEAREAGAELREVVGAAVREAVEGLRHAEPAVWLDTAGAASVLAVHPRTVMKFVAAGRLAASRVGKLWRFRREDVERLLAGRGGSRDAGIELDGASAMRGDLREECVEGGRGRDDVREARGVLREAHGAVGVGLSGSREAYSEVGVGLSGSREAHGDVREVCVERGGSRAALGELGGGLSGSR